MHKTLRSKFVILSAVIIGIVTTCQESVVAVSDDGILEYYLEGLRKTYAEERIGNGVDSIEFVILVREIELDNRADTVRKDTAIVRIAYVKDSSGAFAPLSSEILVSSFVGREPILPRLFRELPWEQHYEFGFFPNDPGSGEIAIRYDSDSAIEFGIPTGFFVIDRSTFRPSYILKRSGGYKPGALSREEWFDTLNERIAPMRVREQFKENRFTDNAYYIVEALVLRLRY